jgi:hypothetical protein
MSNVTVTISAHAPAVRRTTWRDTYSHRKRIFINLNGDSGMSQVKEEDMKLYQDHMKHWRSWGSWFSWGSPVGLGLFLISIAFSVWLLSMAFGWN